MDEEMKKHTPIAPFAYDNDYYLYKDKDEAEKSKFVSFMTQRDAQYKTPAQEVYVGTGLVSEGTELVRESFFLNIDPPVPQIKQIDGYSPEEEESGSSDGGGESGGDTTPDDGCEDPGNGCDEPVEP